LTFWTLNPKPQMSITCDKHVGFRIDILNPKPQTPNGNRLRPACRVGEVLRFMTDDLRFSSLGFRV
jgi:hypothetical protein